jgi:homoserine dehydrogenase
MTSVSLCLTGFGRVGRAFSRLVDEKKEACRIRYSLDLRLVAALKSDGGLCSVRKVGLSKISDLRGDSLHDHPAWNRDLGIDKILLEFEHGCLVECTPTDLKTGEPGLSFIRKALKKGWHIAAASKGALVLNFKELAATARRKNAVLKYSGATAAALPTLDTGQISLAGAEVTRIDGILTGTTNLILSRMEEGLSFGEALKEAQERGIAEPDPSLDIDGWDTACKILLISNAVAGTELQLHDIPRAGIRHVSGEELRIARNRGTSLKLLGRMTRENDKIRAEVGLFALDPSHPLFSISGTNKGVTFLTDTMDQVTVTGGKSGPSGTAAALLKDIINIYAR